MSNDDPYHVRWVKKTKGIGPWWTYFAWPITIIGVILFCIVVTVIQYSLGIDPESREAREEAATVAVRRTASAAREATNRAENTVTVTDTPQAPSLPAELITLAALVEMDIIRDQLAAVNRENNSCETGTLYDDLLTAEVTDFYAEHRGELETITLFDTQGCLVAHAPMPGITDDFFGITSTQWFKEAISGGVFIDTLPDAAYLAALPVYDDDNTVIGVALGEGVHLGH